MKFLASLIIYLTVHPAFGQDPAESAFRNLDSAINRFDDLLLSKSILEFDSLAALYPENGHFLVGSCWARYELGTWYMVHKQGDRVTEGYDANFALAGKLTGFPGFKADGLVLQAAITMNKLSVTGGASAPVLSFKIHGWLDDAEALQPGNPRLHLIRGMMYFFTPRMFGGSAEKALVCFTRSDSCFEKSPDLPGTSYRLGFAETCAWAGQAAIKLDNGPSAKIWLKKALNLQPQYGLVLHQLMPALTEKFPD